VTLGIRLVPTVSGDKVARRLSLALVVILSAAKDLMAIMAMCSLK
jgi:hypothetical protein